MNGAALSWREALRPTPAQLDLALFIAKTLAAGFLALWLSMRFGLDRPATAMVTVFIVSQPQSGFVLAKSAYRAAGTLIGSAATLLLVALFSQQRELFIGAIALWVGACAMGAARFRDFKAYAFVLSGYTACLIGFPAALQAGAAFDIALSRVSEVMLGIVCAGLVADVVAPQRLAPALVALIRTRYGAFAELVAATLRDEIADRADAERRHARLAADIMQMESLRAAAFFEDAESRVRDARLQQLNADFMSALTSFHALERLLARLQAPEQAAVREALRARAAPLAEALAAPPRRAAEAAATLPALRGAMQAIEAAPAPAFDDDALRREFAGAVELLRQLGAEVIAYTRVYASLAAARMPEADENLLSGARFVPHADLPSAFVTGLRAALACVLVCSFWIASDWPDGANAVLNATVVCCLFAASPTPRLAIAQMIVGVLLAVVFGYVCALMVLPLADGFALLALALTPFLLFGLWLLAHAPAAGVGASFLIFFTTLVSPQNPPTHDPAFLINQGLSLAMGMAAGSLIFAVLLPAEGEVRLRRLRRALRRQIEHACTAPLRPALRRRFESHCRDLQAQIQATGGATPARIAATQNYALSVLDIGHAVIAARESLTGAEALRPWREALQPLLAAIVRVCARPDAATRGEVQQRLGALIAALDAADVHSPELRPSLRRVAAALQRVRGGLLDLARAFAGDARDGASDAA